MLYQVGQPIIPGLNRWVLFDYIWCLIGSKWLVYTSMYKSTFWSYNNEQLYIHVYDCIYRSGLSGVAAGSHLFLYIQGPNLAVLNHLIVCTSYSFKNIMFLIAKSNQLIHFAICIHRL